MVCRFCWRYFDDSWALSFLKDRTRSAEHRRKRNYADDCRRLPFLSVENVVNDSAYA